MFSVSMEDTLVFVDNGFFKLVKREFELKANKKFGLFSFFRNICVNENLNLKHLFFYSAPPYQSEEITKKEILLRKNYDLLKKLLSYKKWITLREGRCQRLKVDDDYEFHQKGVDILLAIDLMRFKEKFPSVNKIILIICDSDFVPAIEKLKKEGVEVIIYTYFDRNRNSQFSRYNNLLDSATKWVKIKEEFFE